MDQGIKEEALDYRSAVDTCHMYVSRTKRLLYIMVQY